MLKFYTFCKHAFVRWQSTERNVRSPIILIDQMLSKSKTDLIQLAAVNQLRNCVTSHSSGNMAVFMQKCALDRVTI